MSVTEDSLTLELPRRGDSVPTALARVLTSPRFYVYLSCTIVALITAWHLGKEMLWDTLDYHFYAGFSATHDRFGLDYFPAAWQAYLNPYVYAPFYLLATSGLTALQAALILGAVQSGILWLTYEIATIVTPEDRSRSRMVIAVCAVALAFANPVLIDEVGSSFCDITTAEVVLAGWLVLLTVVRSPSSTRLVCAAALLGAASALKLTNALGAVSALPMLLFIPGEWRAKARRGVLFVLVLAAAFVVVTAPWSIRLEQHFGNPLFPLFNGIFRSPYFTTSPLVDHRFTPTSVAAALQLPFTIVAPRAMIHVEWAAPDLRYALLLVLAALWLIVRTRKALRHEPVEAVTAAASPATRTLGALGCGFATAWILWVTASGNSRYFIAMACVAAVLGIALAFRLFAAYPKVRTYLLLAVFAVQFFQLHVGAEYHESLAWRDAPWFDVSVPRAVASEPALYFTVGEQSDSFVLPYLAPGSGLINLEGVYTLGASGPNGQRIDGLVRKHWPHLQVLVRDWRVDPAHEPSIIVLKSINDALEPFGLTADGSGCSKIIVHGVTPPDIIDTHVGVAPHTLPPVASRDGYLIACPVTPYHGDSAALRAGEQTANLALDHLEEACPQLFQPRGMTTYFLTEKKHGGYLYVRRYPNTDVAAWVSRDWVRFQKLIGGGDEQYAGPEAVWAKRPLRVHCERTSQSDFLKVLEPLK